MTVQGSGQHQAAGHGLLLNEIHAFGDRLIICVHMFKQAVTVEIDSAYVRRRR